MKGYPRYYEMASDDDCAYISSDEENEHELEIKPPQAKIFKRSRSRRDDKHSRSNDSRHLYNSNSHHHHKSHHFREHQEVRYVKERFEQSRSHTKEYDERARKKAYHQTRSDERFKEQDLREKLDRRKRLHPKEYDRSEEESRKERTRKERHRHEVKEHRNHDERRRHRHEERSHARTPEEKRAHSVSEEESMSPIEKNMVIDIEPSPLVLRGEEYSDQEPEEEREDEEGEDESENSDSSSNSSSSDSNESSSENSEESGSSNSSSSEEEKAETTEVKEEGNDVEMNPVSEDTPEDDASPSVIENDNDGVDSEIELEKDTLPSYFPAIQGCRSVEEFQCLNRIEEGTYGVVYRAREKRTDRIVALKRLKMEKEKNGFPITSLREINTLLKAQHPNIVTVKEIVVGSNMDKIFIVMDYVEHDLKSLMETMKHKKKCFTSSEVKCLMLQLLRAVNHLHNNWILHRDLKTSNLLFSHSGILKVGDFGLAREYGSPLKHYTPIVVTLWYRAPELLLGTKEYSTSVDVWSVGCIFAELLCMEPLFPGKTEIDQLKRIFKALGTPNEKMWPEYPKLPVVLKTNLPECPPHGMRTNFVPNILSDIGYNLLTSLLCYNPKKRITADAAMLHEYFAEHPIPIDPGMFSTWPAKSEHGRKAASSPKPPSGGQNYKELRDDDGFYIGVGERGIHPAGFNAESTFSLKF